MPPADAVVNEAAVPTPRATASLLLVVLNVLVFAAMVASGISPITPSPQDVLRWGANFGMLTLAGQWWRLLSSMFLHFGIMHLALNMWCLWSLGSMAERLVGRGSFLLLYLCSGLGGSLLSLAWHPMIISAGASGAIFGLAGGLAALFYLGKVATPPEALKKTRASILTFVVYNIGFGLFNPGIDNAAHIGGLAAGFAIGAMLRPSEETPSLRVLRLPAILASAAVLFISGFLIRREERPIAELGAAEKLLDSGQWQKAAELLGGITAQRPDVAAPHYLLGNAYLAGSQLDQAEKEYQKAIELDANNMNFRLNLGVVYIRKNQPGRAIPQFSEVLAKAPKDHRAQFNLGLAYLEANEYDLALAALEKALVLRPNDPKAHNFMGEAYLGKKEPDQAIANFQTATKLDPKYPEPQEGLCRAYVQAKESRKATACFEDVLKQHPENLRARRILASLYRAAGRTREANALLESAPTAAPKSPVSPTP